MSGAECWTGRGEGPGNFYPWFPSVLAVTTLNILSNNYIRLKET